MPINAALEAKVKELLKAQSWPAAADALLRGYGNEIHRFLLARMPTTEDAEDALQSWCEDVLRGLPNFRGASQLRTWCYQLARHRASKLRRGDGRRRRRITDGGTDVADQIAWEIRTGTAEYQKTTTKDEFRALLTKLDDDDQEVIALYSGLRAVGASAHEDDGDLTWKEIAQFLADDDVTLSDADLVKRAAACRKRHERATGKLRDLYLASKAR